MEMSYLCLEQALLEDPERTVVHDLYHTPTLARFMKRPEALPQQHFLPIGRSAGQL
jgi:hypothetical protein